MTSARTRQRLIERLRAQGIRDERVLTAILKVPRHLLVDEAMASRAYEDTALPIGYGQTISQPYVVALMTQTLLATGIPGRVLEVGTGSGYQTAVLAELVPEVYTVERIEPLLRRSRKRLRELGYRNIHFRLSDGSWGWEAHAPFEAILVTAAPPAIPEALRQQLSPQGHMVIPVGNGTQQELVQLSMRDGEVTEERIERVSFVPLVAGKLRAR